MAYPRYEADSFMVTLLMRITRLPHHVVLILLGYFPVRRRSNIRIAPDSYQAIYGIYNDDMRAFDSILP